MAQTSVNIRMDEKLKESFSAFCDSVGLSVSAAFTLFATQAVHEQRIPFEIRAHVPNAETLAAIAELDTLASTPGHKTYDSIEELFREMGLEE